MTPEATAKTVQYLSEAHATELALTRTLQAHVAMTPRGSYRGLLERHLTETKTQASALEDRLSELGEGRSLFEATWEAALTLGQGILGQALALSKSPLDILRGSGGEEKLLKNAKDECATEALEIATYDALEQLATRTGDTRTAELARRHREQEERMLAGLRELIPGLVDDVVRAELEGVPVYDASETGAADAARAMAAEARKRGGAAADEARQAAEDVSSGARDVASGAAESAHEVAGDVTGTAREASADAAQTARRVGDTASGAAAEIADQVRDGAAEVTADVETGAEETRQDAAEAGRRSAARTRQAGRAARTDAQEAGQAARGRGAAAGGPGGEPWNGYDGQSANEVVRRLGRSPKEQVEKVREYERGHKDRVSVLRAAERQLSAAAS